MVKCHEVTCDEEATRKMKTPDGLKLRVCEEHFWEQAPYTLSPKAYQKALRKRNKGR